MLRFPNRMSKKKGLSLAEKKTKMLEIFHETKDVFQLKDLEKIAPKSKAITLQSVKGVLQELVDDGLVETSKIGISVYFWSFPGKALTELNVKIEDVGKKLKQANAKIAVLEELLKFDETADEDSSKIQECQNEIESLRKIRNNLESKVNASKGLDPEAASRKAIESQAILEAANRWTDNVFTVKTWCKNKFGMEDKALDKNFGIPEDFDYIEEPK